MQKFEKLLPGKFYHVYNRGINGEDIFREYVNYLYFLRLYHKYIDPIGDTYAYCLLKNHFHFLIRIFDPDRVPYPYVKVTDPSLAFSHMFNSYAQSFNKMFERTGGLFQTPFKRKLIEDEEYFRQIIYYIHNNPVKHGFSDSMNDYPWSSFQTLISLKGSRENDSPLVGFFDSKMDFIRFHSQTQEAPEIVPLMFE